jgi:hypothetical protein
MFYTVASEGWSVGQPLPASAERPGLYRSRAGAEEVAAGRPLLVVSVRYDASRGVVVAQDLAFRIPGGLWTAPAIVDDRGVVTVLATIPAELVSVVGQSEIRVHPGTAPASPEPRSIGSSTTSCAMASPRSQGLLPLKALRFLQGSASRSPPGGSGRLAPSG